jgi:hypothetical protein
VNDQTTTLANEMESQFLRRGTLLLSTGGRGQLNRDRTVNAINTISSAPSTTGNERPLARVWLSEPAECFGFDARLESIPAQPTIQAA